MKRDRAHRLTSPSSPKPARRGGLNSPLRVRPLADLGTNLSAKLNFAWVPKCLKSAFVVAQTFQRLLCRGFPIPLNDQLKTFFRY